MHWHTACSRRWSARSGFKRMMVEEGFRPEKRNTAHRRKAAEFLTPILPSVETHVAERLWWLAVLLLPLPGCMHASVRVRGWNQQCLVSCGSVTAQHRQTSKSHKWTEAQNWDETEPRRSFPSGARSLHSRFDWGCLWAQTSSVIVCLWAGSQCLKTVALKIDFTSPCCLVGYASEY